MPSLPSDFSTETQRAEPAAVAARPGPPELVLAFAYGAFAGRERRIIPPEGLVLGRREALFGDGALDDPRISRRHAEVRFERGQVVVRDLGSRNKTYVNGKEALGSNPLVPGDVVRVGDTFFVIALSSEPAEAVD